VPYDAPIFDVNVDITLSHTAPDDLNLLLVGPHGHQVLLMADSGSSFDAAHVELRFDDEAPIPLPDSGQLTTDYYRPANYLGADDFAAPTPALNGNTSLAAFDGTRASGSWRLFAMDDAAVDTGTIESWTLTLGLRPQPYPAGLQSVGCRPSATWT
jgi:hypothetical protein